MLGMRQNSIERKLKKNRRSASQRRGATPALNLLRENVSLEIVLRTTGLTLEQIQNL
jgi:hypothetical protein